MTTQKKSGDTNKELEIYNTYMLDNGFKHNDVVCEDPRCGFGPLLHFQRCPKCNSMTYHLTLKEWGLVALEERMKEEEEENDTC